MSHRSLGTLPVEYIRDVVYGRADETELLLDIVQPLTVNGPRPAIVQLHGGGWIKGEKEPASNHTLAQHGFFTVSINYRLSPAHIFPAHIHDCKAAVRWLRANAERYKIDPNRIGVWGGSAGGHLAALLGTSYGVKELEGTSGSPGFSSRVQAVVSVCGASDLSQPPDGYWQNDPASEPSLLFGGLVRDKAELVRLANPITHIRPDTPPILLIHGDEDEVAPFLHSQLLDVALREAGADVTLVRAKGKAHGFSEPWQQRIDTLRLEFFKKHLQK